MRIFFKSIVIGIPVTVTFFDYFGYVARVEGVSMSPVLNPTGVNTDYVFLSRWAVRNYHVKRGDIVSLISPKSPDQTIIKRIVGLEGDVVKTLGYKNTYQKIPQGSFWAEGENSGNSLDSNCFGPVSLGLITAKATHIVWPPSRMRALSSEIPKQRQPITIAKPSNHLNQ